MGKTNSEIVKPPHELRASVIPGIPPAFAQFIRYGMVSAVALAVDMGLLYVLTDYVGVNYLVSATISFTFGLIVNYVLSIRYVFSNSKYNRSREFLLFSIIGLGGLLINDAVIYMLVLVGMWYMLAKAAATGIGFLFNFVCRKMLFSDQTGREG